MQQQPNVIELATTDAIPAALREQICNCTGRKLGSWSVNELARLQAIHGDRAQLALLTGYGSYRSPELRITDNKSLDALMQYDPTGYCIYTLAIIVDLPCDYDGIRARAEAYKKLSLAPTDAIDATSRILRRLMSFANPKFIRDKVAAKWPSFVHVAILQDTVASWLRKITEIAREIGVRPEEIPHTTNLGQLYTAFRLQQYGRSHMSEHDALVQDMGLVADDLLFMEMRGRKIQQRMQERNIRVVERANKGLKMPPMFAKGE